MVIRRVKCGKAATSDSTSAETLMRDIEVTAEEQVSTNWKEERLIMIPKKEDLGKCENHRAITLLSVPGNVLNRVLLNLIEDSIDVQLRDQQSGFRKDRLCTDQIVTLRIIVEQSVGWNSSLYIDFLDYEKAFDSVDRRTL
ncbi:unnamed protein product [Schistosoma curassoni]|uniref:Reverse transcriptase domain-containing protein n=1 Tax=Schistosoma curassoni TaxID=6186 RepID=A0A183KD57_9TREM|nr:unnamed protein product [Schistosoma curassoni]